MSRSLVRLVGVGLLTLVVLPLHILPEPGVSGSPAEHLRSLAGSYYGALLVGVIGLALLSLPLAFTGLPRRIADALAPPAKALLLAPTGRIFAVTVGLGSALLALLLSVLVFSLQPALVDATSQLVHARYLAAGRLAGPELTLPEFFSFQYMVNLPTGWVSQYPPAHIVLLALGYALGAPWIVGPALVGVTVMLTSLVAEGLLPEDRMAARLGTLFLALSLFFLGHAASYMNHVAAAAFAALAVLAMLRAQGSGKHAYGWLVVAGLATGAVFSTRPLTGVVVGAVALALPFLLGPEGAAAVEPLRTLRRLPLFVAGCLPPLVGVGVYNRHFFGSPTRFGYLAAEGPGHGLGFHQDPWGNPYGPLDGLAQASTDLLALGLDLLVTPLSVVLLIGIYLLLGPSRPRALFVLLLWGLLPVVAHFFYWHHDLVMGPRMLNEYAPPWAILTALAMLELLRRSRTVRSTFPKRLDVHGAVASAFLLSGAVALTLMVPHRVLLYAYQWGPDTRTSLPHVEEASLVFVHGGWAERLGARLAAHGMRIDSIRMALRHNTSCEVQEFLDARGPTASRGTGPVGGSERQPTARLFFQARAGVEITEAVLVPGVTVRTHAEEEPTPECLRQANADRHGTLPLPELLWQGDLPGLAPEGAMFARDLGPDLNPRLLDRHPNREALVYLRLEPHRPPILLPYREAMRLLWERPDGP